MKKRLTVLITIIALFALSNVVLAEEYIMKVNDYTLSTDQYNKRVKTYDEELSDDEIKDKIFNNFIENVVLKELLIKIGLKITEEDLYEKLRHFESVITSKINDTYSLGRFSGDNPPKEKIINRLVGFEETDFTYDQFIRELESNTMYEKIMNYYQKIAEEKFENGEMDQALKKKFKEFVNNNIEKYQGFDKEKQEKYSDTIKKVKEMTFQEYKQRLKEETDTVSEKGNQLFDQAQNKIYDELVIKVSEDNDNQPEIINAVNNNNLNAVKNFIKDGIDPNTKGKDGNTALIYAAQNDYLEIAKLLIEYGANVNLGNDNDVTALMKVSANNYYEIAKFLINNGAKVNLKDNNGWTALMVASRYNAKEVVKLLLENNASTYIENYDGTTALMLASGSNSVEVAKLLIENGAKVTKENDRYFTALIYASANNSVEVARLLLKNGADTNLYSNYYNENVAQKIAEQKGYDEILNLLDQYSKSSKQEKSDE
ncbi:MAG: ankyrin repeat domain-containing protein [Halanaerobiales bacterium]|nr:ankyrin repeat domain-containing protein [Halanaerobiales bacterium]